MSTEQKQGIKLKCSQCGWEWVYRGKRTVFTNCPNCYRKVRIIK